MVCKLQNGPQMQLVRVSETFSLCMKILLHDVETLQHTTVITPWGFQCSVSLCSVFSFNNKNVNTLTAGELLGFTCTCSLTMNSKFQLYHTRQSLEQH